MKILENTNAPNPRRLRIFLAEKKIDVPFEQVDLKGLEQMGDAFKAINPMKSVPVLLLDDGTILCESVAICRYFEVLNPTPPLFGEGALEIATIEMWLWRAELNFFYAVRQAFRHIHPAMVEREIPQVPAWGEANKPKAVAFLELLNGELSGRDYVAGHSFSIADITVLVAFDLMKLAKIEAPGELTHLHDWYARVCARPSVSA